MTGFAALNLKIPLFLAISIFMSSLNFRLSRVEHEKRFITLRPVCVIYQGKRRHAD